MEKKNDIKENFYFSFGKITKIWIPIILTIFIVLNIPFISDSIGTNLNMNFQPSSGSGEAYFYSPDYFKNKNNKSNKTNNNNDISIAIWVLFLIICVIVGIIYFIKYKLKSTNEPKVEDKADYIELLKDDSDFEGNI